MVQQVMLCAISISDQEQKKVGRKGDAVGAAEEEMAMYTISRECLLLGWFFVGYREPKTLHELVVRSMEG